MNKQWAITATINYEDGTEGRQGLVRCVNEHTVEYILGKLLRRERHGRVVSSFVFTVVTPADTSTDPC